METFVRTHVSLQYRLSLQWIDGCDFFEEIHLGEQEGE